MKHVGDITKLNGAELPVVDVITGGSPCQDLSVAGKRAGLDGERSGLFMEQVRVVKEMREHDRSTGRADEFIRPRYMVWENVPGAFSSNGGKDFQAVLTEIVRISDPEAPDVPLPEKGKWTKAGCLYDEMGRWSIAWRVHDAQFWGVPQRRKRIALVADFNGLSAPEILFVRKGLQRDSGQSGEEREDAPTAIGESTQGTGKCLNAWDVQSKHVQPADGVAETLYAGECRYGGGESYVFDGSRRHGYEQFVNVSETVQAHYGTCGGNTPLVVNEPTVFNGENVTNPINASNPKPGDPCHTLGTDSRNYVVGALSFQERAGKPGGGKGILIQNEHVGALSTMNIQSVLTYEKDD